MFIHYRFQNNN